MKYMIDAYARAVELGNDPHVRVFLQAASAQTTRTPPTQSA